MKPDFAEARNGRLLYAVPMKNKNKRELEKRWATEAAKKRKAEKKSQPAEKTLARPVRGSSGKEPDPTL